MRVDVSGRIQSQSLRTQMKKSIWCGGCGLGNLQTMFTSAVIRKVAQDHNLDVNNHRELNKVLDKIAFGSGIGCTARMPGHFDFNTFHTTHGRSLSFATGLKMARPDLHVIDTAGDGDMAAIGGNHFIHAARRNMDITVLTYNNDSYGMTGAQASPTSQEGWFGTSAPYGVFEPSFNLIKLAMGAGATFVAQGAITTNQEHLEQVEDLIYEALCHKGYSFVNIMGTCHTGWGEKNKKGDATEYRHFLEGRALPIEKWTTLPLQEQDKFFPLGIIHKEEKPDLQNSPAFLKVKKLAEKDPFNYDAADEISVMDEDPLEVKRRIAIRFAGSGGQGVVKASEIAAEAFLLSGINVAYTKNYGPEARGGEAYSNLIVSEGQIHYPEANILDVLISLNNHTFNKFRGNVAPDGNIIANSTEIKETYGDPRVISSPIGDILVREVRPPKKDLGINVLAVAIASGCLDLLPQRAVEDAVKKVFAGKSPALNNRALEAGFREAARIKEAR